MFGNFKIGSHQSIAKAGFEQGSSWSRPPD
jgi:hypothetical protein